MTEDNDSTDGKERPALDPRVEEEVSGALSEEEIIGMYTGAGSSEERVPLIEGFAPDSDNWSGKTIFERGQPRAVTLADNLSEAFPVLKPSEELIDTVISDYEMRLTSLEGISRDQLVRVFSSMFGGGGPEGAEDANTLELALSAGPENDD